MSREDHGRISPSKLYRCYVCPGSVRESASVEHPEPIDDDGEETGSIFARRGTWQHEATQARFGGKSWQDCPAPAVELGITDQNRADVDWCADQVREIVNVCGPESVVLWERRLDLSELGMDGGEHGCRVDVLVVVPGEFVAVIDLKFGFKWVPGPAKNPQFRAYSWGALNSFGGHTVWAIKLQPTLYEEQRYREHKFGSDELVMVGDEIKTIIDACDNPAAPLVRGDHCGFCEAKETCRMWRDTWLELPQHVAIFEHMNRIEPSQRGELLSNLDAAISWAAGAKKSIAAWAFAHRDGSVCGIDGYEIGPGRGSRDWNDPKEARKIIRELCKEKGKEYRDCVNPPQPATPKSPYDVEQVLGKSKAVTERLEKLIDKQPGVDALKKVRKL